MIKQHGFPTTAFIASHVIQFSGCDSRRACHRCSQRLCRSAPPQKTNLTAATLFPLSQLFQSARSFLSRFLPHIGTFKAANGPRFWSTIFQRVKRRQKQRKIEHPLSRQRLNHCMKKETLSVHFPIHARKHLRNDFALSLAHWHFAFPQTSQRISRFAWLPAPEMSCSQPAIWQYKDDLKVLAR